MFKLLCEVHLRACGMWPERKKPSRRRFLIFYSIPFYFNQYVCLSTMQFLPHSIHRHTNYEPPRLLCVWLSCGSAQCPADTYPVTPYLYSSLIAFSHSSCVKCRKNRYPLIDSKEVKILSSPKGQVSSEEVLNQSLPLWNKKFEPSGSKSWSVASCNENVPLLRCIKVERLYNANDNSLKIMEMLWTLYTHNWVNIAYCYLLWWWHHLLRESKINTEI